MTYLRSADSLAIEIPSTTLEHWQCSLHHQWIYVMAISPVSWEWNAVSTLNSLTKQGVQGSFSCLAGPGFATFDKGLQFVMYEYRKKPISEYYVGEWLVKAIVSFQVVCSFITQSDWTCIHYWILFIPVCWTKPTLQTNLPKRLRFHPVHD